MVGTTGVSYFIASACDCSYGADYPQRTLLLRLMVRSAASVIGVVRELNFLLQAYIFTHKYDKNLVCRRSGGTGIKNIDLLVKVFYFSFQIASRS